MLHLRAFYSLLFFLFLSFVNCQTQPGHLTNCDVATTCDNCTQINSCIWCETNSKCLAGGLFGPDNNVACDDWRWKLCFVSTKILMIIVASVLGVILLIVLVCLCRCFCCTGRRSKAKEDPKYEPLKDEEASPLSEQPEEPQPSRHPKTDLKRKELEAKYNIKFGSSKKTNTSV